MALVLALGMAAGISVPRAQEARDRSVAERAARDFDALRRAAFDYVSAHGTWPPEAGPGEVPEGLEAFLPADFRFVGEDYAFDWDHWRLPEGLPRHPELREFVAISMTTRLPRVGAALGRRLGPDAAWYVLDDRYTYVLEGP